MAIHNPAKSTILKLIHILIGKAWQVLEGVKMLAIVGLKGVFFPG